MQRSTKTHFNNLDATRFLSFILIFLSHILYTNSSELSNSNTYLFIESYLKIGSLGLDYFFVLSSFLISWVIFEEYNQTNKFSVRLFFIRRSLRIWPLYFFIVLLGYTVVSLNNQIIGNSSEALPSIFYFLSFSINFFIANHGHKFLFFLVFLWSIAVEEQFYLFWALVLKYLRKYFVLICFSLIALSICFRMIYLDNQDILYFHSISLLGNFAIGSLLAYISFYKTPIFSRVLQLKKGGILFIYLIIALNFVFYHTIYSSPIFIVLEKIIFSVFFGFIIWEQSFSENSIIKLGRWKKINYLGKISYGLYCYHGVVITVVFKIAEQCSQANNFAQVLFFNPLIIFMFTVALSVVSYELVEKRILKLKNKFYPAY